MQDQIEKRFTELLERGRRLKEKLPRDQYGIEYWVLTDDVPEYQAWVSSTANLLRVVALPDSYFVEESSRILSDTDLGTGIPSHVIQKFYAVLSAAYEDWSAGLLRKVEHLVAAATFAQFLDHAELYHKGNKKVEAAVLASAVLEDTIKKIASKNSVKPTGKSLEPLIDGLAAKDVFSQVRCKRVKSYAAVRNHALHAEWDSLDIRDVGDLIQGTRELIEEYL